jgi:hypothetical protein
MNQANNEEKIDVVWYERDFEFITQIFYRKEPCGMSI